MKKLLTALLIVLGIQTAGAQTEKNIEFKCADCGILYTEKTQQTESAGKTVGKILGAVLEAAAGSNTSTESHGEYLDAVHDAIAGGIGACRRIYVMSGNYSADNLAGSGCDMYFDGTISAISTTRRVNVWEDKDKKKHEDIEYRGNITGTVNLKDAKDGSILATYTINSSAYSESWLSSPDKALGYCISSIKNWLTYNLNLAYPLYASIVEGSTVKKDKQKEVYIDLGAPDGVYKGMKFTVYVVGQVAGKETKREIGRLKVEEVQGDEISLCKVMKGGADIKEAIDAGKTLQITSRE